MMLKLFILFYFTKFLVKSNDEFIENLLSKMTIEEKCGQMNQITFETITNCDCPSTNTDGTPSFCSCPPNINDLNKNPVNLTKLEEAINKYKIGSIFNAPYTIAHSAFIWQQIIETVQNISLSSRLKIPILYGLDSIHGANYIQEATLLPQPLAMASSFNIEIAKKVGEITAMETRAVGVTWNFNPVLDIGRQHLWPRLYETYGEDVYLSIKMGEAYIQGSQGDSLKNRTKVATCLKHFIGYSHPFNGRDRTDAWIPDSILREYFLPPFAAGVLADSPTVMINSATVNGIPGHANGYYINDILKGELKFEGFTVSDWEDVNKLHFRDKVVSNQEEAVRLAVMSGVDMSMVPLGYSFFIHCVNLANKDKKFTNRVNEAVKRILKVKQKIGLFDDNGKASFPVNNDLKNVNSQESYSFNLESARESIILTKNDDSYLPLTKDRKILIVGTSGNSLRVLNGGWSYDWQGNIEEKFKQFAKNTKTILQAIEDKMKETKPIYVEGANFTHTINLDKVIEEAIKSQVIILCIGEDSYAEAKGNIENLFLQDAQQRLADKVLELNKEIVLVYLGGRPRIITNIVENKNVKSVLISFLPGNRGAEAIADIIFGDYNPDGKLPISYPKNPNGQSTYDRRPLENDNEYYEYLYPFGHGLSFTKFEYSDLKLSSNEVDFGKQIEINVKIRNIHDRDGKETVILYLNDDVASISRPIKQVKGFKKIYLKKNEEQIVKFVLKSDDFEFINQKCQKIAENGVFNVYVGNLSAKFNLINTPEMNYGKIISHNFVLIANLCFISIYIKKFN